jgi:acetyltransferase-like isoleucine patch superfamily enzyme
MISVKFLYTILKKIKIKLIFMINYFLEKFINKRSPSFKFDTEISRISLFNLVIEKFISNIRSYKLLLRFYYPRFLFLGSNVSFYELRSIKIGRFVKIDKGAHLNGLGKKGLIIGNNVSIGAYSQIIVSGSFANRGEFIYIQDNVGIGPFAHLGGSGGLTIKKNCIIGGYFSCHPENHNFDKLDELIKNQGTIRNEIIINEDCWIGAKVTILSGIVIGKHCVIAAGSVVTKNVEPYSVVGGVPAKVLKKLI